MKKDIEMVIKLGGKLVNENSNNWASTSSIKRTIENDKRMGGGAACSPSAICGI